MDENYFVCKDSPRYERKTTKLKLSCGKHEYFASWNHFKRGQRCPRCHGNRKYTHQEICEEVSKLDSEYLVYSDSPIYRNRYTKLKLYHSICENEFYVSWASFQRGDRPCGCYISSRNETLLREYLKSKKINFKEQVTFDELKVKRKLRYDFGVYENDKLLFLIEYDGKQHFEPIEYFGG